MRLYYYFNGKWCRRAMPETVEEHGLTNQWKLVEPKNRGENAPSRKYGKNIDQNIQEKLMEQSDLSRERMD